mmetsp:Transcript_29891/g.69888  ORF Transcript_29891/g.69888 Transcript_29891/m.69888 type:complete len:269 (-) Transcript_29891:91-897(-)
MFVPPFSERLPAPACDDRVALVMVATGNQQGTAEHRRLAGYKAVADELLPFMRSRGHLHHLVFRDRTAASAVVVAESGGEVVLGGATFRLLLLPAAWLAEAEGEMAAPVRSERDTRMHNAQPVLCMDILATAVAQRRGACGCGHGTRLVNYLKAHLLSEAKRRRALPVLLTQSDDGPQALAFWHKQGLEASAGASACVARLSGSDGKSHIVYDYSVPMLAIGEAAVRSVKPGESTRAQEDLDLELENLEISGEVERGGDVKRTILKKG